MLRAAASFRIHSRYDRTAVRTAFVCWAVGEVPVAACDLEARRQALHVPLEGAGKRLVEVVEVEDERALRGRETADVREVGVAAELCLESLARGVAARSWAMTAAAPR